MVPGSWSAVKANSMNSLTLAATWAPSVNNMGRTFLWFWLLAAAWVRSEDEVDGGDILDAMLGAPPTPQIQIPTIAPVIATTPAPIISPNKPGCAADITAALYDLTVVARKLTYVTADCAQPGQDSTVCAADILSMIRYMGKAAGIISDAVFTCGNIQAGCSQTIADAIGELAHLTGYIVAMEIQCDSSRLFCASQVFSFLSSGLHCAKNIDTAIVQCPLPGEDGGDDGGDDAAGSDGDDGGDGGDGDSSGATTTEAEAPPDLTPDQVKTFYPNGPNGAPPVLGTSPNRLLLGPSLRGKWGRSNPPRAAMAPSILPTTVEGLE